MDEERKASLPQPSPPATASSLDETLPVLVPVPEPVVPPPPFPREDSSDVRQTVPSSGPSGPSLDETLPVTGVTIPHLAPELLERSSGSTRPTRPASAGTLDLLAATPEPARDRPPTSGSWRGDALAASPHARLAALLVPPRDDFDAGRAEALCAAVCREALGDFAPAVVLLSSPERKRAQAVAAFVLTLFDFARQRGGDGERLAQINRWEFTLEAALSGDRIGQPVFLRMGEEERRRPISRAGLDALFAAARRRATVERPASAAEAEEARRQLAEGLSLTLFGDGASPATLELTAGLLGVRTLLGLGAELAGGRCQLPIDELPSVFPGPARDRLPAALDAEVRRLEPLLLRGARAAGEAPLTFRRSTAYLVLAAERLLARAAAAGVRLLERPPRLGAFERLRLVARARWGSLARG